MKEEVVKCYLQGLDATCILVYHFNGFHRLTDMVTLQRQRNTNSSASHVQSKIDWIPPLILITNTAKLSSLLLPRTLSFAPNTNSAPPRRSPVDPKMSDGKKGRRRRSSSLMIYQEPLESPEHMSDQSALPNLNANWVNAKGISPSLTFVLGYISTGEDSLAFTGLLEEFTKALGAFYIQTFCFCVTY